MNEVIVLKEGYSISDGPGRQKACGSITLIKGLHTVLVDTGNPWDKNLIEQGLAKNNLTPENVEYVVCTHGHSDHTGNSNLFTNSIHVYGFDICIGDIYVSHEFKQGIPYEIDENIEVIPTPGHTASDVSVVVRNTPNGTIVITGDLFERAEDLEEPDIWQDNSENPEVQQQNRFSVLNIADYIVPGHGPMFQVPEEFKKQMKMVMFYDEQHSVTEGGQHVETHTECVVIEEM